MLINASRMPKGFSCSNTHSPNKSLFKSFMEALKKDKTKIILNNYSNGSSSLFSLLTFLNGNLNLFSTTQDTLETLSDSFSKLAVSTIGAIGAVDLWQKKNLFSFLGYASLIPISLISNSFNQWVARGFSSGLCGFVLMIDQREIVDDKGKPILDKDGKLQVINGDFQDRGWWNGVSTTIKESIKMLKEIFNKPSRIKKFSHAVLITSLLQMLGPLSGLFGFKKAEAAIRDFAAALGDLAFLLDKNIKNKCSKLTSQNSNFLGINFKSPVVQSSILWIGTAVVDLLKRFNFISERVNNLTQLSLLFDRLASIRFTQGILNVKKD